MEEGPGNRHEKNRENDTGKKEELIQECVIKVSTVNNMDHFYRVRSWNCPTTQWNARAFTHQTVSPTGSASPPRVLIPYTFWVSLTSRTSSSSHGLAESPGAKQRKPHSTPLKWEAGSRVKVSVQRTVPNVWAEIRSGPWVCDENSRSVCSVFYHQLGPQFSQGRGCLPCLEPHNAPSTIPDTWKERKEIFLIETSSEYITHVSHNPQCLFYLLPYYLLLMSYAIPLIWKHTKSFKKLMENWI